MGAAPGTGAAAKAAAVAIVRRVKLELWRSPFPPDKVFRTGSSTRGPSFARGRNFLPAYVSDDDIAMAGDSGANYEDWKAGRASLFRLAADECFELGRIKVYNQAGVSVTNNDLGYYAEDTTENRGDVIDFGIVIDGTDTKLAAFSGNNVDRFIENSIKNNGASFSVAGNYLSPRTPRISGEVTGRDELLTAASEAGMRGVLSQEVMPDTTAPMLTESGEDGPMLDGKMLTLTFVDAGMLDEDAVPSKDAFSVMVSSGGRNVIYDVMSVNVEGMTVVLTLEDTIDATTGITVSYTKPGSGDVLMDTVGNEVASFSNVAVTVEPMEPEEPMMPTRPAASTGGGDGGCALASAGSAGAGMGMLLPMLAGLAFILGRKARRVS